jgi:glycine/D-amino acid oxidase-like deaminating enzyme
VIPDVVVVGGGIVGSATAAFLAAAGARVTVYERTEIAAAASGRNSGVVQHPFDPVLVGLYRRSVDLYRDLAAELPDAFRLGDEPAGLLLVGSTAAAPAAAGLVDAWAHTYPEARAELVEGAALVTLEPSLARDLVACRLDIGFPVAPASATRAYAALAERLGARVVTGASAALVVDADGAAAVEVDGLHVAAGAVVVAAGPWTPSVVGAAGIGLGSPWPPIRSSWGVVVGITLERPPRHVLEEIDIDIEPTDGGDGSAAREAGYGFSLVTADGATALGSTFLPEPPDESAAEGPLRDRGARYVPAIASAPVVGMRTCARPVSPDGRPLIGPIAGVRGAYVAAGHGPWGISTGPGSARLMADLVLGRTDAVPAALDPNRFGAPTAPDQRVPLPG